MAQPTIPTVADRRPGDAARRTTPVKLTGRVKARLRALAAAADCTMSEAVDALTDGVNPAQLRLTVLRLRADAAAHAASVAEREAKTSGGRT